LTSAPPAKLIGSLTSAPPAKLERLGQEQERERENIAEDHLPLVDLVAASKNNLRVTRATLGKGTLQELRGTSAAIVFDCDPSARRVVLPCSDVEEFRNHLEVHHATQSHIDEEYVLTLCLRSFKITTAWSGQCGWLSVTSSLLRREIPCAGTQIFPSSRECLARQPCINVTLLGRQIW